MNSNLHLSSCLLSTSYIRPHGHNQSPLSYEYLLLAIIPLKCRRIIWLSMRKWTRFDQWQHLLSLIKTTMMNNYTGSAPPIEPPLHQVIRLDFSSFPPSCSVSMNFTTVCIMMINPTAALWLLMVPSSIQLVTFFLRWLEPILPCLDTYISNGDVSWSATSVATSSLSHPSPLINNILSARTTLNNPAHADSQTSTSYHIMSPTQ